jgi:F-box and WD-40 domain protein CDC4
MFREAEDATVAMEQLQHEQNILRDANGSVQTVENFEPWVETDPEQINSSFAVLRRDSEQRLASPESIADYEETADMDPEPSRVKRRRISQTDEPELERTLQAHPRIRGIRSANPITPESQSRPVRTSSRHASAQPARSTEPHLPSPNLEQGSSFGNAAVSPRPDFQSAFAANGSRLRGASYDTVVPTPPIESDEGREPVRPVSRRALSSIPARLQVSGSPSALDGSLPSPSLSPVTAAATLQHGGYFADIESNSESQLDYPMSSHDFRDRTPTRSFFGRPDSAHGTLTPTESPTVPTNFSINDIPAMLDYFEALPDELKSYVMHQLLRRCPKPTLHVIADAVNPALKCDFLTVLPLEMALNVVRFLDLQSLTRAAQVSKKWRQLINTNEKVWKDLFEGDGFEMAEGEMQQAITEGWGWQDPHGPDGFEMNINPGVSIKSETDSSASPKYVRSTGGLRRSKRKAATMLSSKAKQIKRKHNSRESSVDLNNIMEQMSTAEGPYHAANAAILTVPDPTGSSPDMKNMHLYKSLYRRHYLIRKNWMNEETKPRHIAFRAHDTHVVTCLQFDTDKIVTGSDDNNIHVYDTKTGALRAKLIGHEGGVWALEYEGNTLVSGSTDRSVRVWDIEKGEERQVFRGHTSTVRCLRILMPTKVGENAERKPIMMPRHPLIITGSRDSTLRVWRLPRSDDPKFIQAETDTDSEESPYLIRTLTGHQHSVRAIAAHADTLVSGSYDCTVRVWKISTGETVYRLQGHTSKVYSVVLDHERNRCISGSMDNMVRIWSLDTGSMIYTLEGHTSLVGLLDLSFDRLVSAAADSTLRIWDPDNGQCKATLTAHTGAITCFQHDAQKVISGSDRTLKLWNIKNGECVKDLLGELSGMWQVKFNERRCVAAVQREGVTFIEVSFHLSTSREIC